MFVYLNTIFVHSHTDKNRLVTFNKSNADYLQVADI